MVCQGMRGTAGFYIELMRKGPSVARSPLTLELM
jgi:hypothetical protein